MLFDKSDDIPNERILYKAKPNMLFGCKKVIYGVVLLAIVLMISPMAIKFIGEMQVYLISRINLPLTRYAAIAFFIIILCIIIYIIWHLLSWYSKEYTLTDSRVIVKSGVLSSKRNYMPYATIQDINTSQSIIARLFRIGSISLFSAYDNNQMELSNISNPSKVEDIIFSNMVNSRSYHEPSMFPRSNPSFERGFQSNEDYYDEFEPITPIGRENNISRREYEYYPEDLGYNEERYNRYEYEPYEDNFHRSHDNNSIRYEGASNSYSKASHYNEPMDDYSYGGDGHYQNNEPDFYYDEDVENISPKQPQDIEESSEKVIRRHFDKFRK